MKPWQYPLISLNKTSLKNTIDEQNITNYSERIFKKKKKKIIYYNDNSWADFNGWIAICAVLD